MSRELKKEKLKGKTKKQREAGFARAAKRCKGKTGSKSKPKSTRPKPKKTISSSKSEPKPRSKPSTAGIPKLTKRKDIDTMLSAVARSKRLNIGWEIKFAIKSEIFRVSMEEGLFMLKSGGQSIAGTRATMKKLLYARLPKRRRKK